MLSTKYFCSLADAHSGGFWTVDQDGVYIGRIVLEDYTYGVPATYTSVAADGRTLGVCANQADALELFEQMINGSAGAVPP
jgi:hypothetical protein